MPAEPGRTAREVKLLRPSARCAALAGTSARLRRRSRVDFARSSFRHFRTGVCDIELEQNNSTNGTTTDSGKLFFAHRPSFSPSPSRWRRRSTSSGCVRSGTSRGRGLWASMRGRGTSWPSLKWCIACIVAYGRRRLTASQTKHTSSSYMQIKQVQRRKKKRHRPARRSQAPSQHTAEERNDASEIVAKAMDEASGSNDVLKWNPEQLATECLLLSAQYSIMIMCAFIQLHATA